MRRNLEILVIDTLLVLHGRQAHQVARAAGLRPTFSGVRQGWVADERRLADLIAYCEHRNIAYTVVRGGGDAA